MIGALILGVLAGAIARFLIPGDAFEHLEGAKSWLATIVLGLVGAFVCWLIFAGLLGIVGAVIGSVLVLLGAGWVLRRSSRTA